MIRRWLVLPLLFAAASSQGREWRVEPGGVPLGTALERAVDGDSVLVAGGVHRGPFVVRRSLHLIGERRPVLDGGGRGTVISLQAPDASLQGFIVRASGTSLDEENSGIAVGAPRVVVRDNRLEDVLFGIYLRRAPGSRVEENVVRGMDLDLPRRGDAVRVWYSDGVRIRGNRISHARDVVLWYSSDLEVLGNSVTAGRYGLHFMYCDDASIRDNALVGNSVGAFLMYSRRLHLVGNRISDNHGPSGYGVGLKDMDDAVVRDNLFLANRVGAYLDNSPRESTSTSEVTGNVFAANEAGVLLMPNVRRAVIESNDFLENGEQVAFGGAGADPEANLWRGNHWSDYTGYDADGDGTGDVPYRAEKLFESVADRTPELRVFAGSPAAAALDFAAQAFPVVKPRPKLVDPVPRLHPVAVAGVPSPAPSGAPGSWAATAALLALGALAVVALPRLGGMTGGVSDSVESVGETPSAPVEVKDLSVVLGGREILRGVSFAVEPGEAVALWGSNGAGKTTALRALLGLVPFSGEIVVDGLDARRHSRGVRARIGFVPQEVTLQGDLSVRDTFTLYAGLRGVAGGVDPGRIEWLGLTAHLDEAVETLSGGLKQRLALGLALLGDPPLLLLDEPTANLDAAGRRLFHRLLDELRSRGKTLVFTSHRSEEVSRLADRVLRLEDGRLLEAEAVAAGGVPLRLELVAASEGEEAAGRLREAGLLARWDGRSLWIEIPGEVQRG
ncbi:MAG: nitrous oxide reductase family maturation protein NosD [Thermoanaerobaculia bacterium]